MGCPVRAARRQLPMEGGWREGVGGNGVTGVTGHRRQILELSVAGSLTTVSGALLGDRMALPYRPSAHRASAGRERRVALHPEPGTGRWRKTHSDRAWCAASASAHRAPYWEPVKGRRMPPWSAARRPFWWCQSCSVLVSCSRLGRSEPHGIVGWDVVIGMAEEGEFTTAGPSQSSPLP